MAPATVAAAKPTAGRAGRAAHVRSERQGSEAGHSQQRTAVRGRLQHVSRPIPSKPIRETPPGSGGKVDIFTTAFLPLPPNPVDQNPAWQEVNKQLNATVNFNTVSQADFQAKFAALMAGDDLPDIVLVRDATPNISQILQTQAADLTPYLGGDAVKDYPNLAAIPTFSWKNNGGVQNGQLYMMPIHRYAPGYMLYRNSEIYDAEIGPTTRPRTPTTSSASSSS